MQLFIRGLGDIAVVEVSGADSVADVKKDIAKQHGLNEGDINLYCENELLDDNKTAGELLSYELDIIAPMLGGKVHGSLARAGKVKGQTPKVEKQEKKKKKTGRAKRRIQYNRRFQNVVSVGGRRRGPNANSS